MSVQIIRKDGEPEYAVLPYAEYTRLAVESEIFATDAGLRRSRSFNPIESPWFGPVCLVVWEGGLVSEGRPFLSR